MIINEHCYEEMKKSLRQWKDDYVLFLKQSGIEDIESIPRGQRNGMFDHEIEIREKEIQFFEAVRSGTATLPDLAPFKTIPSQLIAARQAKELPPQRLAKDTELTELDIIAYEIFDYRPAAFEHMISIADAIGNAPQCKGPLLDISQDPQFKSLLLRWKEDREQDKYQPENSPWWQDYGDSPSQWIRAWEAKLCHSRAQIIAPKPDTISSFSDALIMWRQAKKWSYKQLAEAVGLDWLMIWFFERNSYYGVSFATMLAISDTLEHIHHSEPSDLSFDPDFSEA